MNFGPEAGGNFTCELNQDHSSKGNQSSPVLQSKKDHIYLAIENPCISSPCLNNGTCQAGYTVKGFRCRCPLGFTGARCTTGKNISFLIGGGCDVNVVRAELIVDNKVVRNETGNCLETMYRKSWDVEEFIGHYAKVRLVDEKICCWGHINFDDLKGDIICPHD
ncbi:sushi, von Willebrand factor type A, EGF and pentraxin domain-containing protein 1-like isoform X2 [Stylophora pistillata]|uniref:sushi, von Willebrand factor type A, EGF and pentraxin domain-containing protein 1-like isoform X2 n=1 Tax=Stylophora pistillata TaxID=50429 RepID=UPI000C044836|nr:sushi, von Willebrand factor type A, EGF and pentraxin domain-containing protein 1-like isoform X2 [Stylophora pistillata]